MNKPTVLIVDDEQQIRELLAIYFTKEGFKIEEAADGAEGLMKFQQVKPDIVILDIMLPVIDGLEVCSQLRKFSNVPIIMLTARAEDDERILGLDMGADDYITKPFNPKEVVARIKAVLRRSQSSPINSGEIVRFSQLEINISEHKVLAFGEEIHFANKEIDVLWYLATNPGRVFSREQLLENVWGYDYFGDTRTVDTHIKRIRKKLKAGQETPWDIKTVWGIGYKFEVKN